MQQAYSKPASLSVVLLAKLTLHTDYSPDGYLLHVATHYSY